MSKKKNVEKKVENSKYDELPYPSYPYPNTNPERLYTIGKLFGMQPVDFRNCKVLELGCASGGNIIPLATMFPNSTFVGIDLSETQIKHGQEQITALQLKNVTLKILSISDIDKKFGEFDYIIAHGVLSWVPKNIQDKIFKIFSENLSKEGIAYVSYNTLPGWNAVKSIREMMLYHTKDFSKPEDKVQQARLLLKFIKEANAGLSTPYAQEINSEIEHLDSANDAYLLHDHLEENNDGFYFHEVVEKAAGNDLQYLGDTGIASMFIGNFPNPIAETLSQAANDLVRVEQYMDFIRNRRFRSSLFCHKDVVLNRNINPEVMEDFYIVSQISTETDLNNVDLTSRNEIVVTFPNGVRYATSNPGVILAIRNLCAQKRKPIAVKELLNKVFDEAGPSLDKKTARLVILEQLLRLAFADAVGIHSFSGNFVSGVSEKPEASKLARVQAERNEWVTNQRHEKTNIDLFNRILIQYLDGSNSFEDILARMLKHAQNDDFAITLNGEKITAKDQLEEGLATMTKQNIENLVPFAILVA